MAKNSIEYPDIRVNVILSPPGTGKTLPTISISSSGIGHTGDPNQQPPLANQRIMMVISGYILFALDTSKLASPQQSGYWSFPDAVFCDGSMANFFGITIYNWTRDLNRAARLVNGTQVQLVNLCSTNTTHTYCVTVIGKGGEVLSIDPTIKDQPMS